MKEEVMHAAQWWADRLNRQVGTNTTVFRLVAEADGSTSKHVSTKPLSANRVELFRHHLTKQLLARYEGHW